jgi:hypothetical protein
MPEFIKEVTLASVEDEINTFKRGVSGQRTLAATSDTTLTGSDLDNYDLIECDPTSNDVDITLPDQGSNAGLRIKIRNVTGSASYVVNVVAGGSDTITGDEMTTIELPVMGNYVELFSSSVSGAWEILDEAITCQLRLDTYAGFGSTDTKIMRFTNVRDNIGNIFAENHVSGYASNAEGLEITISRSGKYSFTFTASGSAITDIGLSLDSSELTTNIISLTNIDDRLCVGSTVLSGATSVVSIDIYLDKDQIIRPHTNGSVPSTADRCSFIASYIGQ